MAEDKDMSARAFYQRGNDHYERGEFRSAIWYYDRAIKKDSANYKFYYNRGLAKACLEEYDSALEDFWAVLKISEDFVDARYLIGLAYEYKGDRDEAIKQYSIVLELNPDHSDAKNRLELCKSKPRKKADVSEALKQVKILESEGEYDKAAQILEGALEDNKDSSGLLFELRTVKGELALRTESDKEILIGLEEVKEEFETSVVFPLKFSDDPLYKAPIAQSAKGLMLFGPPGCGKTLSVRILAKEAGIVMIEVVLSEVLNLYVGESEKRLTEVFHKAQELARSGKPVLLFIDEVDALGFGRRMTLEANESYWSQSLLATFLRLFNEIKDIPNIIVVGATNHPWTVDTALKGEHRLGEPVYCPPPDEKTREEIFRYYSRHTPGHESLDFKQLAGLAQWFSGSDIESICRKVHMKIAKLNQIKIAEEYEKKHRKTTQRGAVPRTGMREAPDVKATTIDYVEKIEMKRGTRVLSWFNEVAEAYRAGKINDQLDLRLKEQILQACGEHALDRSMDKSEEKEKGNANEAPGRRRSYIA